MIEVPIKSDGQLTNFTIIKENVVGFFGLPNGHTMVYLKGYFSKEILIHYETFKALYKTIN